MSVVTAGTIQTDIPARLDRLPWSRFHLLVVVALGITWVLDGLEVTIVGSIGPMLQDPQTLALTDQDIGTRRRPATSPARWSARCCSAG